VVFMVSFNQNGARDSRRNIQTQLALADTVVDLQFKMCDRKSVRGQIQTCAERQQTYI